MIATTQPPIEEIVRTIVDTVHPRRVVLFGSRSRGDARPDSDVDLMVELDSATDRRARARELSSITSRPGCRVDVRVYSAAGFAYQINDPGTTVYDIAREGKLLYCRDGVDPTPAGVVHEGSEPPHSIAWWLRAAEDDLLDIENNLTAKRTPWPAVAFHAQQAAEKYLKALLISRWEHPKRTHNLADLLDACRKAGVPLPALDADCALLTGLDVSARYPDYEHPFDEPPPPPTPMECQAALGASRRIVAAVSQHLPPKES